jgi:hypothetical protein
MPDALVGKVFELSFRGFENPAGCKSSNWQPLTLELIGARKAGRQRGVID